MISGLRIVTTVLGLHVTIPNGDRHRENAKNSLIVTKITQFIAKMNIAPLPRNYELIFEILAGHNPAMGREVLALGNAPQQHELDIVGQRHGLAGFSRIAASKATNDAAETLEQIAARLDAGLHRTEVFLSSLQTVEPEHVSRLVRDIHDEQTSLKNFLAHGLQKIRATEKNSTHIQAVSLRDTLTTLPNRAAFLEKLTAMYEEGDAPSAASMLLVNIDHFREINAKYGPAAGNKALRRLAALFRKTIKKDDFVARIGGNEFAFIFMGVAQNTAQSIAERLRRSVEDLRFATRDGDGDHLTISVGVAALDGAATPAEFYSHAELALLAARSSARNCVVGYSRDVAQRSRNSYLLQLGG